MCFTVISCFPLPFVTVTLFPMPILFFYFVSVVAFYVFSLCPFCVLYMFFVYYLFVRKLFYQVAYLQYSLSRLVQITLVLFFSLLLSWGCSMFLTFSPISSSCHCFVPFIILYCLYLVLSQYCTICSLSCCTLCNIRSYQSCLLCCKFSRIRCIVQIFIQALLWFLFVPYE